MDKAQLIGHLVSWEVWNLVSWEFRKFGIWEVGNLEILEFWNFEEPRRAAPPGPAADPPGP